MKINNLDKKNINQEAIDKITSEIKIVYKEVGSSTGMIKMLNNVQFNSGMQKKMSPNQSWFTKECAKYRKLFYSAKNTNI